MKNNNGIFIGILFLVAAVLIILNALGYTMGIGPIEIALTAVLVVCLAKSIVKISFGGILFSVSFLLIIYAEQLHIPQSIIPWPLLLFAMFATIGFNLIFRKSIRYKNFKTKQNAYYKHHGGDVEGVGENVFDKTSKNVDGDYIMEKNIFGGSTRYIKSQNLMHADLSNQFGELKVYFDNANITANIATIVVTNSFGETHLYIPKTWNMENHLMATFGSIRDDNDIYQNENGPTVVVEGNVSFGEVKIFRV